VRGRKQAPSLYRLSGRAAKASLQNAVDGRARLFVAHAPAIPSGVKERMSNRVAAGTILAEKYRLVSLLGRGGMGEVWHAEHLGLRAPVAIKLMKPEIVSDPEALARFNREAQAAASLRSPHVVQVLDHGLDPILRAPFIAMEMMEGESLGARLERLGRLSPADTARIVTHIARALARAHEAGIVHRDLKPDNVFLVPGDDEEIAKVLDFGIAKANTQSLDPGSATRTGAVMGTPYYMSPEQISGAKGVDFRTDLWALGVIACQCLTGRLPFQAETIGGLALAICAEPMPRPSQLGPTPAGFDAWFERAVAREPAQRFQSARELAGELRRACGVESFAQAPTPPEANSPLINAVSAFSVSNTSARLPLNRPSKLGWVLALGLGLVACVALAFSVFGRSRALTNPGDLASAAAPTASMAPLTAPPPSVVARESAAQVTSQPTAPAVPQRAPSAAAPATAAPIPKRPASRPAARPPSTTTPVTPTQPKPDPDSSVFDRRKG
jgi:eukaryotic-like serine/threonine-protein kinase